MTIFNASNQSAGQIISNVQSKLLSIRIALDGIAELYRWSSGVAAADLQAAPFSMTATDAATLLAAIADAHALALIYTTGLPPASYPQPASAYNYSASQSQVMGSLLWVSACFAVR